MSAPIDYKKAIHSLEKYNESNRLAYRNGEPLFIILDCPEKDHADSNVVILKKIKVVDPLEAILGLIFGGGNDGTKR